MLRFLCIVRFGFAFIVALLVPAAPMAAAMPDTAPTYQLQVFVENDVFAGTDRYYTNGLKFGLGQLLQPVQAGFKALPESMLNWLSASSADTNFGFFAGQNIYTPRNIRVVENQPNDRPWAAWLYLGAVAQRVEATRLDTVELDIGVVGPAALGEAVQSNWHKLIGAPQPKGWDNQLPSEAAFSLAYLHKRKFEVGGVEWIAHGGVTLGTVTTQARVGGMARFGQHMTGFGPDTIEPGGTTLQCTRDAKHCAPSTEWEWYVFVGGDMRLVAHNIFLDGTLFHDSPSVDRRSRVYDLNAGFAFRYQKLNLSFTRIRRSEEFTTAAGGGGSQIYHSLNVGWVFE